MTQPIPAAFRHAFAAATPSAFARASADPEVSHGTLVAVLHAEFAPVAAGGIGRPDRLAERFALARDRSPLDQLRHVGAVLAAEMTVVDDAEAGIEDLLPHRVRARGRGHELACIMLAIVAAERAGLDLDLVASPAMALLAHPELDEPMVLQPARRWALVDARTLGQPELAWICPHEAAALWLRLLSERALVAGSRDIALRALDLELELPMAGPERQRLERLRATIRHGLS